MAPKRGGGGSGGSGGSISIDSCPGAFQGIYGVEVSDFVSYCIFWFVTLLTLVGLWKVKKRHPHAKRLVGPIYLVSLLCFLLGFTLIIIGSVLLECGTTPPRTYYNWAIAFTIFFRIGTFLLLVVIVWGMNSVLRRQLGHSPGFLKIIYGIILGFVGVLTAAVIGLQCYNISTNLSASRRFSSNRLLEEQVKLMMAYWVFYLLSVAAGAALAIVTIVSMRSRRIPTGDLVGWVIGITLSMFIWVLFVIIEVGASLDYNYLGETTLQAFQYIISIFQSLSWIFLLFLAKSTVLANNPGDESNTQVHYDPTYAPPQPPVYPPVPQQQYAYNGNGTQQYYYQQQPIYNGTPSPVNGNGQMMQAK